MNYREYKWMQVFGAILLCIGLYAAHAEFIIAAAVAFALGLLVFLSGVAGAWFNDD